MIKKILDNIPEPYVAIFTEMTAGITEAVVFVVITISIIKNPAHAVYLPFYMGIELAAFIVFGIPGAAIVAAASTVVSIGMLLINVSWSPVLAIITYWSSIYILHKYIEYITAEEGVHRLEIENIEKDAGVTAMENEELEKIILSLELRKKRFNSLADFAIKMSTTLNYEKLHIYIKEFLSSVFTDSGVRVLSEPEDIYDSWVIDKRQPLLVENTYRDHRFLTTAQQKAISVIVCPVISGNSISGLIRIDSRSDRFSPQDLRLLNTVSSISSIALDNIRLFMKTQELAVRDGLTGLYTQSYLKERLIEEVDRAARYGESFSFIMLDIDNFKKFNDTYGHQAGDEVLVKVALEVQKTARETDLTGRYGGEEIGVILRNITSDESVKIAEKIRRAIEKTEFRFDDSVCSVTATLGLAAFPSYMTAESLLHHADEALYKGKRAGRNRVEVNG